jgi:hypothetical protein
MLRCNSLRWYAFRMSARFACQRGMCCSWCSLMGVEVCTVRRGGSRRRSDNLTPRSRTVRSFVLGIFLAGLVAVQPVHAGTPPVALDLACHGSPQFDANLKWYWAADENVPQARSASRPQVAAALNAGLLVVRNFCSDTAVQSSVETQGAAARLLRESLGITCQRQDASDVTPINVAQAEARLCRGLADLNGGEAALAFEEAAYVPVIGATFALSARWSLLKTHQGWV